MLFTVQQQQTISKKVEGRGRSMPGLLVELKMPLAAENLKIHAN